MITLVAGISYYDQQSVLRLFSYPTDTAFPAYPLAAVMPVYFQQLHLPVLLIGCNR
jgi:hypothetical protein